MWSERSLYPPAMQLSRAFSVLCVFLRFLSQCSMNPYVYTTEQYEVNAVSVEPTRVGSRTTVYEPKIAGSPSLKAVHAHAIRPRTGPKTHENQKMRFLEHCSKIAFKLKRAVVADAQADLSLRCAHSHFVGFVMRWLKFET